MNVKVTDHPSEETLSQRMTEIEVTFLDNNSGDVVASCEPLVVPINDRVSEKALDLKIELEEGGLEYADEVRAGFYDSVIKCHWKRHGICEGLSKLAVQDVIMNNVPHY